MGTSNHSIQQGVEEERREGDGTKCGFRYVWLCTASHSRCVLFLRTKHLAYAESILSN